MIVQKLSDGTYRLKDLSPEQIMKNPIAYGVRSTRNLQMAKKWATEGKGTIGVLMGENGMYMAAPNRRIESILNKSGYELIKGF